MAVTAPSPSLLAAAGLVAGFAAARYTHRRELGGAVFAVAGAGAGWEWARRAGPVPAAALGAVYTLAMGGSHPLAKQIGPWPSVLLVTAGAALASEAITRRRS